MNPINLKDPSLNSILTPVEYEKIHYSAPYILDLKDNEKELLYYGTEHSNNPRDEKFDDIEKKFNELLMRHPKEKITIAFETKVPSEILSRDEMISKYRESGFLYYLAQKNNISIICPEPQEKILPLVKEFGGYSSFAMKSWVFLNKVMYSWKSPFASPFKGKIKNLLDRSKNSNIFQKISSNFSHVRDRYIASGIKEELQKGNSVFAVFGTNHVVAQKLFFENYFSIF